MQYGGQESVNEKLTPLQKDTTYAAPMGHGAALMAAYQECACQAARSHGLSRRSLLQMTDGEAWSFVSN